MKIRAFLLSFLLLGTILSTAQNKYVGGDISLLKQYVDAGAVYKDKDGTTVEPLSFFAQQGWNTMRLRLFVDPSKASADDIKEGVIQDLPYVIALGKQIKDAGFRLMLDFHYSDTWTDPGQHSTPSAWSSLTVAQITTKLYDYTKDCLQQLKAAGVTPDFIQTGNEITYGMLWPTAHIWPAGGGQDGGTWDAFADYLESAIKACREVCPRAKIVIHTEMSKSSNVTNFYNQLAKYSNVSYDIIGLSYYPDYHGTLQTLNSTLTTLEQQHADKDIMIVEAGYSFQWHLGGNKYDLSSTYPLTEEGQRKFTADLVTTLQQHEKVTGLYWWFPEDNEYGIVFKDGNTDWSKQLRGYWNAPLFNQETGKALAALYELKNFVSGSVGWPANYGGVMLQGFSWDSFVDTQWTNLESQADDLSSYFDLIWVPQSGNCNSTYNQMGYTPVYYFDQNSSFGSEAQLRSMINAYKQRGTGIIADVVINHRNNLGVNGSWVDYPAETYDGVTYQMLPTDICGNDDGGKTKAWADGQGITLGNNETTEDWDGCRDLDHSSANVQHIVKVYEDYLLNDLGYVGFRYDMTKGFNRSYLATYNSIAQPQFSVGEYWDGNAATLKNVISQMTLNGMPQSATFDFAFRYSARDACNAGNWTKLANGGLATQQGYSRYAVTFVENHDMQDRGSVSGYTKDPITKNVAAANAWMLAMPGTPCVFLLHWKAYQEEIKQMILARKVVGITNESNWQQVSSTSQNYQLLTTGSSGKLYALIGSGYYSDANYVQILKGDNYTYYLSRDTETPWASKPGGTYTDAVNVMLTAVSTDTNAQLVYTLDGTTPTASSTKVATGSAVTISESCVLKVGLLTNNTVKNVISRNYTIKPFTPHQATIYLKDPSWSNVYFYAWANDGNNTQLCGSWPGTAITATKEIQGANWYYRAFDVNTAGYSFNIIFDQGSGQKQTVDIGPLSEDTYYEIAEEINGKFTVKDVTSSVTGITDLTIHSADLPAGNIYTLDGRLVRTASSMDASSAANRFAGLPKGIYIVGGKKLIIK